tara:strand:- start:1892 stop:2707 length:816 start_codon:yes stop_codon:yes gene_type:complete
MNNKGNNFLAFGGIGLLVLVVIIGFIVLFMIGTFPNISVGGSPPVEKDIVWNSYPVHYITPFDGRVLSSEQSFCGNEEVTLSNSVENLNTLILRSSMSGACNGENFIDATINLPVGKLTGTCDLGSSISRNDANFRTTCQVDGKEIAWVHAFEQGDSRHSTFPLSSSESFELIIDEPRTIKVRLTSKSSNGGSSNNELSLNFIPLTTTEAEEEIIEQTQDTIPQDSTPLDDVIEDVLQPVESSNLFLWILGGMGLLVIFIIIAVVVVLVRE